MSLYGDGHGYFVIHLPERKATRDLLRRVVLLTHDPTTFDVLGSEGSTNVRKARRY